MIPSLVGGDLWKDIENDQVRSLSRDNSFYPRRLSTIPIDYDNYFSRGRLKFVFKNSEKLLVPNQSSWENFEYLFSSMKDNYESITAEGQSKPHNGVGKKAIAEHPN